VQWFGPDAVEVTYKDPKGTVANELVFRDAEARLQLVEEGRPWSFDGDGELFRLVSEAQRIHLAHLFDPHLAVHTSLVEPLPHQITAVYESMLPRQPLRFLLADDPGAGKTIMAGLLIKELIARGDLQRCLAGLKASHIPPPRKITAEACFILRLMVEASRRAMLREQDDEEEVKIYAMPLVPGPRGDREDTFVIRAGKMLQSLWVGSKSSPALLSRLPIAQHFDELPYDCFALVVMSRWASARCVMSMANCPNRPLAAIVGQTAIQIWRATAMWPPVESSAELDFVRRLDQVLGIVVEETEELIAHYRALAAALIPTAQAAE
jgi:hypothetical protein